MMDRKFHRLQLSAEVGYDDVVLVSSLLFSQTKGINGIMIFHCQNHIGRRDLLSSWKILVWFALYHVTVILLFLLLFTDVDEYVSHSTCILSFGIFRKFPHDRFVEATLIITFSFSRIVLSVL